MEVYKFSFNRGKSFTLLVFFVSELEEESDGCELIPALSEKACGYRQEFERTRNDWVRLSSQSSALSCNISVS